MRKPRKRKPIDWTEPTERSNAAIDASHFKANLEAEMEAYDRLPKQVAQWLDEAPKKYSAVQIEQLVNDGYTLHLGVLQPPKRSYGKYSFRTGTWN